MAKQLLKERFQELAGIKSLSEKKQADDGYDYLNAKYTSKPWTKNSTNTSNIPLGQFLARGLEPGDYIKLNKGPHVGEYATIIGKNNREVYYTHHSLTKGTFADISKFDLKPSRTKRKGKSVWLFKYR